MSRRVLCVSYLFPPVGGSGVYRPLGLTRHLPTWGWTVDVLTAGDDRVSPENSIMMYLALKRAGIPAELHIYATAAHDFGVRPSDHPCSTWTTACAAWLRHQGLLSRKSSLSVCEQGQHCSPLANGPKLHFAGAGRKSN